ncbi:glycosyltransferase family 77 [Brachionus plicatilis]|uniref:Glycosyltransferase family 77 n=1 Tax=Brachionus plicatilis TaxID=10195 RepID=A0A3M7QS97_BRAPC|nr:glycosyltransferase family 77 [Brachionus plicatilis]
MSQNNVKENLDPCFQIDSYLSKYKNPDNLTLSSEEHQILEVINKNKINDMIIVTVSNYGFRDLTLNWILSLEKINIKKFVIFSFDKEFVDYLFSKGYKDNVVKIPKNWIYLSVDKSPASFLSTNYYAITQAKTNVIYKLLILNQKFIFSDVDCVWLNKAVLNYVSLIMKHSKAHMIYAQDFVDGQPYFNTGFFYGTPTNFTKNLYYMMSKMQEHNNKSVDQFVFDGVLKKINFNDNRLAIFDILTIANGKYYFHQRMDKVFNFVPFVVHANYFPSYETKINALKSRKHWFI